MQIRICIHHFTREMYSWRRMYSSIICKSSGKIFSWHFSVSCEITSNFFETSIHLPTSGAFSSRRQKYYSICPLTSSLLYPSVAHGEGYKSSVRSCEENDGSQYSTTDQTEGPARTQESIDLRDKDRAQGPSAAAWGCQPAHVHTLHTHTFMERKKWLLCYETLLEDLDTVCFMHWAIKQQH